MKPLTIALFAVLATVPVLAYALAVICLPDTVPLHFGIDGSPNRWGSKYELVVIGAVFAGVNLLMALLYAFAPQLDRRGLINLPAGNDRVRNARIVLIIVAIVIDVVALCCLGFVLYSVQSAL